MRMLTLTKFKLLFRGLSNRITKIKTPVYAITSFTLSVLVAAGIVLLFLELIVGIAYRGESVTRLKSLGNLLSISIVLCTLLTFIIYNLLVTGTNKQLLFTLLEEISFKPQQNSLVQIKQGFERNEFSLYYQAQVRPDRTVCGVEALLRWHHPDKGLIPPYQFLPLIEDDDLSVTIGEWVIKTALLQIRKWQYKGIYVPVSVNLGAKQLQQTEFISKLSVILEEFSDQEITHLKFEILETSALVDIGHVTKVMSSCNAKGITFALDDFGTGYSSLSYLNMFNIEYLKIDQSFVRDLEVNPKNMTLCEAIIAMAHKLGMRVIAEGIETEEQSKLLFNVGCDIGQGYLFSRPITADQFLLKFYHEC